MVYIDIELLSKLVGPFPELNVVNLCHVFLSNFVQQTETIIYKNDGTFASL